MFCLNFQPFCFFKLIKKKEHQMLKDANLKASGIQLFQRSYLTPPPSSASDIYDLGLYNPSSTEHCRSLSLDEEKKIRAVLCEDPAPHLCRQSWASLPLSSAKVSRRSFDLLPHCDWLLHDDTAPEIPSRL